ncbi:MAG: DUF1852 family protein [Planctomycetes bacterium]|nr:DUF1852 family protein [Planctomycetota bacterium]
MAVTRYLDKEIINIPEKQTLGPRQSDPCKPALPVELKDLIHFTLSSVPYDADYVVDKDTRATTNFANFARDCSGQGQNINSFLPLVNADLNILLDQDDGCDRYAIKLEILSIRGHIQSPPGDAGGRTGSPKRPDPPRTNWPKFLLLPAGLRLSHRVAAVAASTRIAPGD